MGWAVVRSRKNWKKRSFGSSVSPRESVDYVDFLTSSSMESLSFEKYVVFRIIKLYLSNRNCPRVQFKNRDPAKIEPSSRLMPGHWNGN
jgi:hypothetical protein